MRETLCIGLGGAFGTVARYWLSGWIASREGHAMPWGTILVNISGCFLIGVLASVASDETRWLMPPLLRKAFTIGFCGGYTTFSAFSLQTLALAENRLWWLAGCNVVLSVILCLIAVWIGNYLGEWIHSQR